MPSSSTMLIVRTGVLLGCLVLVPGIALVGVSFSNLFEPAGQSADSHSLGGAAGDSELQELQQLAGMSHTAEGGGKSRHAPYGQTPQIARSTVPAFFGDGGDERSYWEQPPTGLMESFGVAEVGASAPASPAGQTPPPDPQAALAHREADSSSADRPAAGEPPARRVPWARQAANPHVANQHGAQQPATGQPAPGQSTNQQMMVAQPLRGEQAAESGNAAAASLAASDTQQDAMRAIIGQLQALGAVYFKLEAWGQVSEFRCEMPVPGNERYHAFFEATHPDPVQAMAEVLEKVRAWQQQPPQPPAHQPGRGNALIALPPPLPAADSTAPAYRR